MKENTEQLPKGYTCACGMEHKYPSYVYAHWREVLTHECDKCGRKNKTVCGVATIARRGKAPTGAHERDDEASPREMQAALPRREVFDSTRWVAELERALGHIKSAGDGVIEAGEEMLALKLTRIEVALWAIVQRTRRRSHTGQS
jgi:hypothetical protein